MFKVINIIKGQRSTNKKLPVEEMINEKKAHQKTKSLSLNELYKIIK